MDAGLARLDFLGKQLGLPNGLDSFDDRLIWQKTIYLASKFDLDLGYQYRWYRYGPFSQDLADDLYKKRYADLTTIATRFAAAGELSRDNFLKFLQEVDRLTEDPKKSRTLVASILFLKTDLMSVGTILTEQNVGSKLREYGKDFDDSLTTRAWNLLITKELIQ